MKKTIKSTKPVAIAPSMLKAFDGAKKALDHEEELIRAMLGGTVEAGITVDNVELTNAMEVSIRTRAYVSKGLAYNEVLIPDAVKRDLGRGALVAKMTDLAGKPEGQSFKRMIRRGIKFGLLPIQHPETFKAVSDGNVETANNQIWLTSPEKQTKDGKTVTVQVPSTNEAPTFIPQAEIDIVYSRVNPNLKGADNKKGKSTDATIIQHNLVNPDLWIDQLIDVTTNRKVKNGVPFNMGKLSIEDLKRLSRMKSIFLTIANTGTIEQTSWDVITEELNSRGGADTVIRDVASV